MRLSFYGEMALMSHLSDHYSFMCLEIGQLGGNVFIPPIHTDSVRTNSTFCLRKAVKIDLAELFTFGKDEVALIIGDRTGEEVETSLLPERKAASSSRTSCRSSSGRSLAPGISS